MSVRVTGTILTLVSATALLVALSWAQDADMTSKGSQAYATHCAACHQVSGEGLAPAFPPLAGHVSRLLAADGGRAYLLRVVTFGLQGAIDVDGTTYDGVMPSWSGLDDATIAAVLNHVSTGWSEDNALPEGFEPFGAEDVAAVRPEALTSQQVYALRAELALEAPADAEDAETMELIPAWFNAAQASQAQAEYLRRCSECHGDRLQGGVVGGPPLTGTTFAQHWKSGTAAALFTYMRARMPQNRPGSLPDQTYVNMLSLILRGNGYPAGQQPLTSDLSFLERLSLDR